MTYALPRAPRASAVLSSESTRSEVLACLSSPGVQMWLRERGRDGVIFGEVVLPLQGGGATLKVWGLGVLYVVREAEVTACGVASCPTRAAYDRITGEQRALHAAGRFVKRRIRKGATP